MKTITIELEDYKWLAILAPDSKLSKKDLCQLLKITEGGLRDRINSGTFPKNTHTRDIGNHKNTLQWTAQVVREAIKPFINQPK